MASAWTPRSSQAALSYWGTFASHYDDAAGTSRGRAIVAILKEWAERAVDIRVARIMSARVVAVLLKLDGAELALASMHLDLALTVGRRSALLGAIRLWVDSAPGALVLIGGDCNVVPSDETRMTEEGSDARSTAPASALSDSSEIWRKSARRTSLGLAALHRGTAPLEAESAAVALALTTSRRSRSLGALRSLGAYPIRGGRVTMSRLRLL